MEEKVIIETIPALTTIEEATSSFSLIAWFNTYEPFIIFIIKIVLTIILLIPTIKTYKVFIDDLNYHKGAIFLIWIVLYKEQLYHIPLLFQE